MRFIISEKERLKKSRFYNEEECWDYPLTELDHVLIDSKPKNEMIYVICEDKRIYETICSQNEIKQLYNDLGQNPILREFEMAALSCYIKIYVKNGLEPANETLEKWAENMKVYNPNKEEILKEAKTILDSFKHRVRNEEDMNYVVFVLGYDLLNEELSSVPYPECDLAYDRCKNIAEDFLNSEYNVNTKSLYDCLNDYIEDRKYEKFIYEDDESLEKGD